MRLGRLVAQTLAYALSTDARRVSSTSTDDGLERCSLTGFRCTGGDFQPAAGFVAPSTRGQEDGDIVERLYLDANTFLDPEPSVCGGPDVAKAAHQVDGVFRRQQET